MYQKVFSFLKAVPVAALALAGLALSACQPQIGDSCVLNTNCSTTGGRQCDTSMPGGYCTVFNCAPNTCPDQSACYLFDPQVQGCPYNDRQPSRTGHSFCMKDCQHDGDCRAGYHCVDARQPPWNAILLDDNQNQSICVPIEFTSNAFGDAGYAQAQVIDGSAPVLPVCQADPDIDAAFPAFPAQADAGALGADSGAGVDAGVDAGVEAGPEPVDAAFDATLDAGIDATLNDAGAGPDASEAGVPDAGAD